MSDKPITISEWQRAAYTVSRVSGFHSKPDDTSTQMASARIALIHSEASEALEEIRHPAFPESARDTRYRESDGKPEGFPSELADIMIRVLDMAETHGVDLEAAMIEKHEFNKGRPHMHGKTI